MSRLLIVEDDDLVRQYLCLALKQAGHDVECVATMAEADVILVPGSFEVVIIDVRLPDGNGRDLASTAASVGIQAVLITGHPDETVLMAINRQAYLQKPFRASELIELVQTLVRPQPVDD